MKVTKEDVIRALMAEARRREGGTATAAHVEARALWVAAEYQHRQEYEDAFTDFNGILFILSGRPPLNLDTWAYEQAKKLSADSYGPTSALEEFKYEIKGDEADTLIPTQFTDLLEAARGR